MGGRSELALCESMGVSSSRCESVRIIAIQCKSVGGGMRWCEVGLSGKCWCGACLLRLLHSHHLAVCCESVMVCERGCVTVSSETLTAWCANLSCEPRCHRRDLGQRPRCLEYHSGATGSSGAYARRCEAVRVWCEDPPLRAAEMASKLNFACLNWAIRGRLWYEPRPWSAPAVIRAR